MWGLENLANLHLLPPTGYRVFAMVQKLQGGSGGPARVVAYPDATSAPAPGRDPQHPHAEM